MKLDVVITVHAISIRPIPEFDGAECVCFEGVTIDGRRKHYCAAPHLDTERVHTDVLRARTKGLPAMVWAGLGTSPVFDRIDVQH